MKNSAAQLQKITGLLKRYAVIICFVIFGAMYAFLLYTSGQQVKEEPSEKQVTDKIQAIKRPKVDEAAVQTLMQLSDQNIEVQSLFNEARNNPFSE